MFPKLAISIWLQPLIHKWGTYSALASSTWILCVNKAYSLQSLAHLLHWHGFSAEMMSILCNLCSELSLMPFGYLHITSLFPSQTICISGCLKPFKLTNICFFAGGLWRKDVVMYYVHKQHWVWRSQFKPTSIQIEIYHGFFRPPEFSWIWIEVLNQITVRYLKFSWAVVGNLWHFLYSLNKVCIGFQFDKP